ncbi:hypothetical protein EJP80_03280 [Rahnella aquatilis]|nr:hypothetical protein EJP80_03280 [Rahnella aquatilis]
MINNKQNALSTSLFMLQNLCSLRCPLDRSATKLIAETLTNQAGEISALEKQLVENTYLLKRAEEFRDYWGTLVCQLLEMEMEDLDFQVIDGVDIERITQKTQAAILAFEAKVTAANKMAASFQQASQNSAPVNIHLDLTIHVEAAPHILESDFVFFGFDPAGANHNAN